MRNCLERSGWRKEMEYMKIEGFLGGAISKLINKGIESKFGYKPDISLDQFHLKTEEEFVEVNMTVKMTQSDFNKLFEEATK